MSRAAGRASWLRPASGILLAAITVQVAVSVLEQGVPTLAFAFQSDLALSATEVGLLVSTFNVGRMAGSIPWGRAVDTRGMRQVLLAGGVGLALAAGAASISPAPLLAPCLLLAGLFAASVSPAGIKMLMGAFHPSRHGTVVGIRQTAIPVGGAIAALTLPWLAVTMGWRVALACAGVGVLLATIPVVLMAPRGTPSRPAEPASSRAVGRTGWRADLRGLADRGILRVTAWAMVLVAAQYGVVTYGLILVQDRFGMAATQGALVIGLAQFAGAAGRVGWVMLGAYVFRGSARFTMVTLTLVGVAGIGMVIGLPATAGAFAVSAAFVLAGVAVTGWPGLYVAFISTRAPAGAVGRTLGYGLTLVNFAALMGPPVLGALIDAFGDHRPAWGLIAVALLVSLLFLRPLRELPRGDLTHALH